MSSIPAEGRCIRTVVNRPRSLTVWVLQLPGGMVFRMSSPARPPSAHNIGHRDCSTVLPSGTKLRVTERCWCVLVSFVPKKFNNTPDLPGVHLEARLSKQAGTNEETLDFTVRPNVARGVRGVVVSNVARVALGQRTAQLAPDSEIPAFTRRGWPERGCETTRLFPFFLSFLYV